ncbi:MAG: DUF1320 family protein, partial [Phycisphaerales bacterium]|nr:DUF1320 family protein [Phycisphaerales bacterium]
VAVNGVVYTSLDNSNTDNDPESSPGFWDAVGEENAFYRSLIDSNGGYPLVDTAWQKGDPRQNILIRHVSNIVAYELHSRINPRFVPELRAQRRDESVKWLKDVANPRKQIYPNFPKRVFEEQKGQDVTWGSNKKRTHGY